MIRVAFFFFLLGALTSCAKYGYTVEVRVATPADKVHLLETETWYSFKDDSPQGSIISYSFSSDFSESQVFYLKVFDKVYDIKVDMGGGKRVVAEQILQVLRPLAPEISRQVGEYGKAPDLKMVASVLEMQSKAFYVELHEREALPNCHKLFRKKTSSEKRSEKVGKIRVYQYRK